MDDIREPAAAAQPDAEPRTRHRLIKSAAKRGPRAKPLRKQPREPVREAPREPVRTQGVKLERARKRTDDRFFIDRRIIPAGVSYEWKREAVYGRKDPHHINQLKDNHWTEVPAGRHPGLITEQDGMILMERPQYLTDEARKEDFQLAQDQVRGVNHRVSETPQGTFPRDHPSARANTRVRREFIPLDIPPE